MKFERIGIVVALREEEQAVQRSILSLPTAQRERVHLKRAGLGIENARRTAAALYEQRTDLQLICSSGFAGALDPAFEIGAIAISFEAHFSGAAAAQANAKTVSFSQKIESTGLHPQGRCAERRLVSVRQPVYTAIEKRDLREREGAALVDMEASGVYAFCQQHELAFLALKSISDTAQEELPAAIGGFLNEAGALQLGALLRFMLGGPRNWRVLGRLRRNSLTAAATLEYAWKELLPKLLKR